MLRAVCFRVKPVGKPDAVAPHVRFDERGWETGLYATAPILDSTGGPLTVKIITYEYFGMQSAIFTHFRLRHAIYNLDPCELVKICICYIKDIFYF
jgi:hypothetical protein